MLFAEDRDAPVAFVLALVQWLYSDEPLEEVAKLASFPISVQSPGSGLTLVGQEELVGALQLFRQAALAMGVVRVESEVVSVSDTGEGLLVVTLDNQRFAKDGRSLGTHRSIYVLVWQDALWRLRSVSVGDMRGSTDVRKGIEEVFQREFGAGELLGTPAGNASRSGEDR